MTEPINVNALFLGPKSENYAFFKEMLNYLMDDHAQWRRYFHPDGSNPRSGRPGEGGRLFRRGAALFRPRYRNERDKPRQSPGSPVEALLLDQSRGHLRHRPGLWSVTHKLYAESSRSYLGGISCALHALQKT